MGTKFGASDWKEYIPVPICEEHPEYNELYIKAWELAFLHIKQKCLLKRRRGGFPVCESVGTGVRHREIHFRGFGGAEITVGAGVLHLVKGIAEHLVVRFLAV